MAISGKRQAIINSTLSVVTDSKIQSTYSCTVENSTRKNVLEASTFVGHSSRVSYLQKVHKQVSSTPSAMANSYE
jgi:hypothetical protein